MEFFLPDPVSNGMDTLISMALHTHISTTNRATWGPHFQNFLGLDPLIEKGFSRVINCDLVDKQS